MKMKSLKTQFIGAIAMVLVAAIAMGSSTYAWFAMNTQVTATKMQVQAKSEGGIIISNETVDNWAKTVNASYAGSGLQVIPTSTSDTSAWYHHTSDDLNDAKAHQTEGYVTVSSNTDFKIASGIGFIDSNKTDDHANVLDTDENAYFLKNIFYIKSSSATAINASGTTPVLYINKVVVSDSDDSMTSGDLDKALRVAIKIAGQVYIYAPFSTTNVAYYVANADSTTSAKGVPATGVVNDGIPTSALDSIPGNAAVKSAGSGQTGAIAAEIYIYFEGEDANCKSRFITETLDNLNVEVVFGTSALA